MAKSDVPAVPDEIGAQFPVLASEDRDEFLAVIQENFGDTGIQPGDLDRIKMPAGGGTAWEVPTLEGEEHFKEVEGIIIAWQSPRVYWAVSLDDQNEPQPPDCSSEEGKVGQGEYGPGSDGNPSGLCAECPMNQWGSADDGKGKACKEQRLIYLLQPGGVLPITVGLPPTSIQPLRKYMLRLASEGIPYYGVTTKLGLTKVTGQFTYSVVVPKLGQRLDPAMREAAKQYGESIKQAVSRTAQVAADAYREGAEAKADA